METNLSNAYDILHGHYMKWLGTLKRKEKSRIEDEVFRITNNKYYIPDEVYFEANDNRASGLCQNGFFERDLKKLINLLGQKLDNR